MSKLILYHGTADEKVTPTFGKGNKHHDYGQGFYLTNDITLAKEWAIFETQRTLNKGELLYQVTFSRGEFDMVVIRPQANEVELYELKHALKQNPRQIKNLINDQLCNWASRLGRITKKIVLYRGETLPPKNGIEYINVMEYLCRLHPEIPITAGQTKYF